MVERARLLIECAFTVPRVRIPLAPRFIFQIFVQTTKEKSVFSNSFCIINLQFDRYAFTYVDVQTILQILFKL